MTTFSSLPVNNELNAAEAFSAQAPVFDRIYGHDSIIRYKRLRVRNHLLQYLSQTSGANDASSHRLLELNAGTGEDALYFAELGYPVHATDISYGMLQELQRKIQLRDTHGNLSYEQCSYLSLAHLSDKGPYDHIFSNFAGLNCTGELDKVLYSLPALLQPNGTVTLVILPPFCLWETLLSLKGKFHTAFRRFFSRNGRAANVEGKSFRCWYYSPSYIQRCLGTDFETLSIEGLCSIVPPSYIEGFAEKYTRTFRQLCKWEDKRKTAWPWKYVGDYYIITLRKRR